MTDLVRRIRAAAGNTTRMIETDVQILLCSHGVDEGTRRVMGQYMRIVVGDLEALRADVLDLCDRV